MEGGVERVGSDSHSRGTFVFGQYCFFLGKEEECVYVCGGDSLDSRSQ